MRDQARPPILAASLNGHRSLIEMMTPRPSEDPTLFVGLSNPYGPMGIYGGHLLGQALSAALATVDQSKLANSLHGYFLQRGDPEVPIHYRVSVLRDGGRSAARAVSALQDDVEIFHMIASFKVPEDGDEHQQTPPEVEKPEALISARRARGEDSFPFPPAQNGWSEIEFADVDQYRR